MKDDRTVSQRNHVGGLRVRIIARIGDVFSVEYVEVQHPVWSLLSGSEPDAQEQADQRVREDVHDCVMLGCPPWFKTPTVLARAGALLREKRQGSER
jgi:hypothetical protein